MLLLPPPTGEDAFIIYYDLFHYDAGSLLGMMAPL